MTSTAMRIQCSCTVDQIATGDLCDFCDHVKCANCGVLPKHEGQSICGTCLDDALQAEFSLRQADCDEYESLPR